MWIFTDHSTEVKEPYGPQKWYCMLSGSGREYGNLESLEEFLTFFGGQWLFLALTFEDVVKRKKNVLSCFLCNWSMCACYKRFGPFL